MFPHPTQPHVLLAFSLAAHHQLCCLLSLLDLACFLRESWVLAFFTAVPSRCWAPTWCFMSSYWWTETSRRFTVCVAGRITPPPKGVRVN